MMIDQPWPASPIRLSADTVTPSRKTSLTSIASLIVRIGPTSTPGAVNGTTNTDSPWCRDDDGSVRISARSHVGPVPVGDPCLLAVDDPGAVVLLHAATADTRNIAARIGLAEQLAPDVLAAPIGGSSVRLLFVRTEMQ